MKDIASAVGITAGALYRHFPNKQEILAQSMLTGCTSLLAALAEADHHDSLAVASALAWYGMDNGCRGVLVDKESYNLTPERRVDVRAGVQAVVTCVADAIRMERPELPESDVILLSWAMMSIAISPAKHGTALPRNQFDPLFHKLFDAVRNAPLLPEEPPARTQPVFDLAERSRREVLMGAAITLFDQYGYQAVTMDDIGSAAGMTSSNIYNYFDSKADILHAILTRGNEILRLGLTQALIAAQSTEDALTRVVHSYTSAVLAPDSAISILIEQSSNMPPETRSTFRSAQREYVEQWVRLLGPVTSEARATVLAAIGLINDLSRVGLESRRCAIEDLARRVLTAQLN